MEAEMPMKPHKGESQDAFMKRCVPDMMGDGKREQDQAVAACMSIWRDDKGQKQPEGKDFADPGYRGDGGKRYVIDTADQVRTAWHNIHRAGEIYTKAQDDRIKARIISAWKVLIDKAGPPDLGDASNRAALRQHVVTVTKQDCPEVDADESHDDYIERCMSEMGDMADDDAEEACQLAWEESNDNERSGDAVLLHKTMATPSTGMEFVLSDGTPDRFGDVIEPLGWKIDTFASNPIALFNHNTSFVIGRWRNLRVTDKDLRGDLELAPKGTSDRIDEIRKLIEADILRATSVGFRPIASAPINAKDPWGGVHYTEHELVETSVVAVPANPNALAVAKGLGVSGNTLRMVFGEQADKGTIVQREYRAQRGEHADTPKRETTTTKQTGEHADPKQIGAQRRTPMLLSQRIQELEKSLLADQDDLDRHLETIDDDNPTEEQMALTEDKTTKIENKQRQLNNLKTVEAKNGNGAIDTSTATAVARRKSNEIRLPAELAPRPAKKADPLDFIVRAAIVRAKSKVEGVSIDDMRRKIYGDDEATRIMTDLVLKAATAPAETTVTGWAAELVRTVWAAWMDVLLPVSVLPKLSAIGLGLTFGQNGRIVIPTRSLTPSIAGAFVGEGQPIPVRQGAFTSQTLTPKKLAVITSWTKEMEDFSIPAIEGLLRQAIIEDTAVALDTVLLDNNVATAIRPPGLRSYGAGLTPSATTPFANFVADYNALYGALLTATKGNVRRPVILLNPTEVQSLSMLQPPNAAAPLFPFMTMLDNNRLVRADLVESSTVTAGTAIMLDAADFTTAGAEGPRMDISDTATLHMEDTAPADIVSGSPGVVATPVKSMWQTDSLALRMIMRLNWIMRRPVVAWMSGVTWK
jgi:HK97 family phage prohead protease/HK97 family phage major capsid protein